MRNYKHIDAYLNELIPDIYPQPTDKVHTRLTQQVIRDFIPDLGCKSVLDVGCGEGFAQPMFEELGIAYTGVCLGEDYIKALEKGRNVQEQDYNFLPYRRETFELIFSRHSLEHSPFPLLTLMEWHRVASKWLCLIVPNPDHFGWIGRNHYSIKDKRQVRWLLRRAGWNVLKTHYNKMEFRYLCEKLPRISYEGYTEAPLSHDEYGRNETQ